MYKMFCRVYQFVFKYVACLLPWRQPMLIEGQNSVKLLPERVKEDGVDKVIVITDKGIASLGLMNTLLKALTDVGVSYVIYDDTTPNPTIENIEEALKLYMKNQCSGIIAFGGGSSMDCAKGVGARVARPNKSIPKMKGLLKILKRIPPLYAVPTTAGTGSEATVVAVVSNPTTHEKYPINDTVLIPRYAVLDPLLTVGLPQHITATTGMDALTHAIEAYIGKSNTKETKRMAEHAVQLICENLYKAYINGSDIKARENMLKASYYAGVAFTRAYVGYIHAVAHTLGGFYGTPHGLANAVILPHVLKYYGKAVHRPLADLADLVGIGSSSDTAEVKSTKFIEEIKRLNRCMNIPSKIKEIKDSDIPFMVKRAFSESNPLYPVPRIFSKKDFYSIYHIIKESPQT